MGSCVESSSGAWVHHQADYWSHAVCLYGWIGYGGKVGHESEHTPSRLSPYNH